MKFSKIFIYFIAFFAITSIDAQTNFLTTIEKPEISDESGQKMMESVEGFSHNAGVQFAKVNSLSESTKGHGMVKFTLGGSEKEYSFMVETVNTTVKMIFIFMQQEEMER
jgi:hypothetical protein